MAVIVKHTLVLNAAGAREETLDGRTYLVVPTVMAKDGVMVANRGALYYSSEENGKNPEAWNHMPLVVYHPEVNGRLVSARKPDILEKRGVGFVFNAEYSSPDLKAESWFDVEKAQKVDKRIVEMIREGKTLNVSTGIKVDLKDGEGDYNGEKYVATVHNIRPDHLAILPDKKGACDVEKGCGCGVNVGNETLTLPEFLQHVLKFDEGTVQQIVDAQQLIVNKKKEPNVEREKLIKDILACNVGYEEADFEGVPDKNLKKTLELAKEKAKVVGNQGKEEPKKEVKEEPKADAPRTITLKEWLVANEAPAVVHQFFDRAEKLEQQEQKRHGDLVANILKVPNNKLSEASLKRMPVDDLADLYASIAPQSQKVIVGNGYGSFALQDVPVGNAGKKPKPLAPVDPMMPAKK